MFYILLRFHFLLLLVLPYLNLNINQEFKYIYFIFYYFYREFQGINACFVYKQTLQVLYFLFSIYSTGFYASKLINNKTILLENLKLAGNSAVFFHILSLICAFIVLTAEILVTSIFPMSLKS